MAAKELDAEDHAMRYFVQLEKQAEEEIPDLVASLSEDELAELVLDWRKDADALRGEGRPQYHDDGSSYALDYFETQGILLEPDCEGLQKIANLFRRVRLENVVRNIERISGNPPKGDDPLFCDLNGFSPVPSLRSDSANAKGETVGGVVDGFLDDLRKANRSEGTLRTYQIPVRILKQYFGVKKPIAEITRADISELLDVLLRYPKNAMQRYPGKSIQEAIRIAEATKGYERIGGVTLRNYFNNIATIFKRAEKMGWITTNPTNDPFFRTRFKVVKKSKAQFSIEKLNRIFQAPLYTGCQNDKMGCNRPGPNKPRRGRFWVPLLGLFQGMRLNECCQLWASDICEADGVAVIRVWLGETEEEMGQKRLKKETTARFIPIHPELLKMGFLDFVEQHREQSGEPRLFPDLKASKAGYYSDAFSKWFSRFVVAVAGKDCQATFHSFRHMFRDALREADVSLERVDALGGWQSTQGMQAHYGQGFKMPTLYEEIRKVEYKGLDLSPLYREQTDEEMMGGSFAKICKRRRSG
ncbi:MAG: site-specific integrase [Verrucomicrobiota bacterium]